MFDRYANSIVLNEKGRKLQYALVNVLGQLDQVIAELLSDEIESVEINILSKNFRSLVMDTVIEYQRQNLGISFKTSFSHDETKYENYDLIVTADPIIIPGFERLQLCSKRLNLKVASNSVMCGRTLTMEQLRDQPFIISSQNSSLYKVLLRVCEKAGFTPKIAMEINDTEYCNRCVKAGLGIGLTRRSMPNYGPEIDFLKVTDFNEQITCYAYYKKVVRCSQIQDFINYLRCKNF